MAKKFLIISVGADIGAITDPTAQKLVGTAVPAMFKKHFDPLKGKIKSSASGSKVECEFTLPEKPEGFDGEKVSGKIRLEVDLKQQKTFWKGECSPKQESNGPKLVQLYVSKAYACKKEIDVYLSKELQTAQTQLKQQELNAQEELKRKRETALQHAKNSREKYLAGVLKTASESEKKDPTWLKKTEAEADKFAKLQYAEALKKLGVSK